MQYMLLIYTPADGTQAATSEAWFQYTTQLQESGVMVAGDGLQGLDTASTVRVREGETLVTDGPFAETKEMLGGYYLIDVPDLDAALAWAAKIPSAPVGSVEVRPVMVYESVEA
ncbi:MAG TPA: YciI family protein [Baekduia sp.]